MLYVINNCDIKDYEPILYLGKLLNNNFDKINNINELINKKEILGYYINEELVGILIYKKLYEIIDLLYIVVNPKYRKRNIGSNLLEYLIKMDYEKILLEVRSDNINAIKLYEKYKFNIINVRKKYYGEKDAYVMELIK